MTERTYIIAEIGINHGGSLETALALVGAAYEAGADAVKFQKRTLEVVYTAEELARPRESVYGSTNGDLKRGLEFGRREYDRIAARCRELGVAWSASAWDEASVGFVMGYGVPWLKVPSPLITDMALLGVYRAAGTPVMMSTGMSTGEEVEAAMGVLGEGCVPLACTSTYPCPPEELNLRYIQTLRGRYGRVGFSSHCTSPWPAVSAVALGATVLEAHLTLDRAMWGSDQASSLEPKAFGKMVEEIRTLEVALGTGEKEVFASERPIRDKLRKR